LHRKNLDFKTFYAELASNEAAKEEFLNYLTINTSGFFRDEHIYSYLADEVIKNLLKEYARLNIWSAGCSTGEEPYTLSIILHEMGAGLRAKILASDIDPGALEKAKRGATIHASWRRSPPGSKRDTFNIRRAVIIFETAINE